MRGIILLSPSNVHAWWSPWFHSSLVQALPGLFRNHLFPLNRWQTICSGFNTDSDPAMKVAGAFLTPKSDRTHWTTFLSTALEPNADMAGTLSRKPASHNTHACTFSWEDHVLCLEEMIFVLWGHVCVEEIISGLLGHEVQAEQFKKKNASLVRWEGRREEGCWGPPPPHRNTDCCY